MSDEVKFFLFGVAVRHLKITDPYFSNYCSVICETMQNPACRQIELTSAKRARLVSLIEDLRAAPDVEDEAFRISLERLNREKGFDPLSLPRAEWLKKKDSEADLKLRDALAVIALAWQIDVYGDKLVLSVAEYDRTVENFSLPLN